MTTFAFQMLGLRTGSDLTMALAQGATVWWGWRPKDLGSFCNKHVSQTLKHLI